MRAFSADTKFKEYLGRDAVQRINAIQSETAGVLAEHNASHAVTEQEALAGYSIARAQLKIAQTAWAQLAAFLEAVGAQAVAPSRSWKAVVAVILTISGLAEANLAFPGVRFSLGRVGQINSPFNDPLSLIIALIIGLISVTVAHFAAHQLSWSERSVMKEPKETGVFHHHFTPRAVHADQPGNAQVLGVSPLVTYTDSLSADPLGDLGSIAEAFPPSAEVQTEEAAQEEEAKRRHEQGLRGGRSRRLSRAIGLGLVALGIGLWTMSGIMRVSYLSHIHPSTAAIGGGVLNAATPIAKPASLVSGPTEVAIVLLSILLFLLSVGIVFAMYSPAQLRAEELRRNAREQTDLLKQVIKEAAPMIHGHEEVKSKIGLAQLKGMTAEASERIPREDF